MRKPVEGGLSGPEDFYSKAKGRFWLMNNPGGGKRIAVVYRSIAGLSGVPGIILDHARRLSHLGYRVTLIGEALDKTRIAQTGAACLRVRRLPLPKLLRLRWFTSRADRLAEKFDFVVGHGHSLRQQVFHLHNCLRLAHEEIHGDAPPGDDPVLRLQERMLRHGEFRFCIANSRLMQRDLMRRYAIPQDKIHVVYPGSDLSRFSPCGRARHRDAARRELGMDGPTVAIGLITSGDFQKRGVDIAIDAFSRLADRIRRRAVLLIIGKSSRLESYRQLAERSGLGDRIRFLPPMPQVERYYHALDIYIHPARFEEFGLSVQEAMACGLPLIASRQIGATELLPPAARDALPARLDAAELVGRMQALIEDESLRRRWSEYGLQAVSDNSDAASFERVLAVYRRAGL